MTEKYRSEPSLTGGRAVGLTRIACVQYPGCDPLALSQFHAAAKLFSPMSIRQGGVLQGEVSLLVLDDGPLVQSTSPSDQSHLHWAVIVPPEARSVMTQVERQTLGEWLSICHEQGSILAVEDSALKLIPDCDHRQPMSRRGCNLWPARVPGRAEDEALALVDNGDIISSRGSVGWLSLMLRVLTRSHGIAALHRTIRQERMQFPLRLLVEMHAKSIRYDHPDDSIRRLQRWLHAREGVDASLEEMAAQAKVTTRTLQRRLEIATGLSPLRYCLELRAQRAKRMLCDGFPLGIVAKECGYGNTGSFGKMFARIAGVAPSRFTRLQYVAGRDMLR